MLCEVGGAAVDICGCVVEMGVMVMVLMLVVGIVMWKVEQPPNCTVSIYVDNQSTLHAITSPPMALDPTSWRPSTNL